MITTENIQKLGFIPSKSFIDVGIESIKISTFYLNNIALVYEQTTGSVLLPFVEKKDTESESVNWIKSFPELIQVIFKTYPAEFKLIVEPIN